MALITIASRIAGNGHHRIHQPHQRIVEAAKIAGQRADRGAGDPALTMTTKKPIISDTRPP